MEYTRLQDGVDIYCMLPASTLHQYANMEYNNEYYYPSMNGKISTYKNSTVFHWIHTLLLQEITKYVHYKIQYIIRSIIHIFLKLKKYLLGYIKYVLISGVKSKILILMSLIPTVFISSYGVLNNSPLPEDSLSLPMILRFKNPPSTP